MDLPKPKSMGGFYCPDLSPCKNILPITLQQHVRQAGEADFARTAEDAVRRPPARDPGADLHHQGGHERTQQADRAATAGKTCMKFNHRHHNP